MKKSTCTLYELIKNAINSMITHFKKGKGRIILIIMATATMWLSALSICNVLDN